MDEEFQDILHCLAAVSAFVIGHIVLKKRRSIGRKRAIWMRPLFKRRANLGTTNTLLLKILSALRSRFGESRKLGVMEFGQGSNVYDLKRP